MLWVGVLVLASVPRYHRLGGLNNRHLLLSVLEAGSLRSGCQHVWVLVTTCFLVMFSCGLPWVYSLSVSLCRKRSHISSSSYKGTNPIMMAPPSWPHLTLITSQRPHLQIPSHWGIGLQHMNFHGTQHIQPIVEGRLGNHWCSIVSKVYTTSSTNSIHFLNNRTTTSDRDTGPRKLLLKGLPYKVEVTN